MTTISVKSRKNLRPKAKTSRKIEKATGRCSSFKSKDKRKEQVWKTVYFLIHAFRYEWMSPNRNKYFETVKLCCDPAPHPVLAVQYCSAANLGPRPALPGQCPAAAPTGTTVRPPVHNFLSAPLRSSWLFKHKPKYPIFRSKCFISTEQRPSNLQSPKIKLFLNSENCSSYFSSSSMLFLYHSTYTILCLNQKQKVLMLKCQIQ